MNAPANRHRDLHRAVESLGNQASGVGLLEEASSLWRIAAAIKAKGAPRAAEQGTENPSVKCPGCWALAGEACRDVLTGAYVPYVHASRTRAAAETGQNRDDHASGVADPAPDQARSGGGRGDS